MKLLTITLHSDMDSALYCISFHFIGPDRMAEWSWHETCKPRVLGSNPPQAMTVPTVHATWLNHPA